MQHLHVAEQNEFEVENYTHTVHSLKCKRKFLSRDVSDQFIFLAVVCLQLENEISMARLRFTFSVIAFFLSFGNNVALAVCPFMSAAFDTFKKIWLIMHKSVLYLLALVNAAVTWFVWLKQSWSSDTKRFLCPSGHLSSSAR